MALSLHATLHSADPAHLHLFSERLNQQANILDILSIEIVTGLISLGAISMSIGTVVAFAKSLGKLQPKLAKVEHRLNHLHNGMENCQSTVTELSELIPPLRQQESNLQFYYDEIKELSLELERKQLISEQVEKGEKHITIQHRTVEVL